MWPARMPFRSLSRSIHHPHPPSLDPYLHLFYLCSSFGIQLAMHLNEYFNTVQELEDAAHAAGAAARPEWPPFWSDAARWASVTRISAAIAVQELAIKLTKHVVENVLAGELPGRTMAAMLANPAGAIKAAAAASSKLVGAPGARSLPAVVKGNNEAAMARVGLLSAKPIGRGAGSYGGV